MSRVNRRIWAALVVVYVVWGSTYLAIRVSDRTIPPFLMAGARFLVAGSLLFVWAVRRAGAEDDPLGPRQWLAATLIGALLLLGGNGGVVWAERRVPSGVSALLIATVPIWMAVITALRDRQGVAFRVVAGLVVGSGGTALLVRAAGAGGGTVSAVGVAALLGAALSWAAGSVLSQRVPLPRRPLVATAMEMLCGGALLGLFSVVVGEAERFHPSRVSIESLTGFLYLIVFGSWLGFTAYVWLLKNTTTSLVSTYAYVIPDLAVFLRWVILSERVTLLTLAAAALIVSAVALIVLGQRRATPPVREPVPASSADGPPMAEEAAT
jgi:drug/metabolite transporter (DMT)-like permease